MSEEGHKAFKHQETEVEQPYGPSDTHHFYFREEYSISGWHPREDYPGPGGDAQVQPEHLTLWHLLQLVGTN